MSHALLAPSGASRWLECTPSARLEAQFPDKRGDAADEGTLAHALAELILRYKTKQVTKAAYSKALAKIQENKWYDAAMQECCDNYATQILESFSGAQAHTKDALLFIEERIDLTEFVPEGFGTGDAFIIADKVLEFNDLKYGKGIPVSAVENKQMMLYGLGAYYKFSIVYDIERVRMTIRQPRLDSISTWEISVPDLLQWAEDELKPKAKKAFSGEGEYIAGPHCRFCKARAVCRANADFNLELTKYEFKKPDLLEAAEVSHILDRADMFNQWLKDVEDHALNEAVNNGAHWPGYKLVEGRSVRKYSDPQAVLQTLINADHPEAKISKKEPLGITEMEKVLGKAAFAELLGSLIIKPPGKPTLAPENDKRPEYSSAASAAKDFAQ